MNPTNVRYEFIWKRENRGNENETGANFFNSVTSRGYILSGKKFDMIFEYTPS